MTDAPALKLACERQQLPTMLNSAIVHPADAFTELSPAIAETVVPSKKVTLSAVALTVPVRLIWGRLVMAWFAAPTAPMLLFRQQSPPDVFHPAGQAVL